MIIKLPAAHKFVLIKRKEKFRYQIIKLYTVSKEAF